MKCSLPIFVAKTEAPIANQPTCWPLFASEVEPDGEDPEKVGDENAGAEHTASARQVNSAQLSHISGGKHFVRIQV